MTKSSQMYPATQLMTIEEAQRLSTLEGCELSHQEKQRARLWSWQTIDGAMSQTIDDEQIERLAKKAR